MYPNFETFWRGTKAAGPCQGVIRIVGEDKLKESLHKGVSPFCDNAGVIRIEPNMFRYVVATP